MTVISVFWFVAGALSAVTVMLLLGPSLRALRGHSRWLVGGCLVAVAAAMALYMRLGAPDALFSSTVITPPHGGTATAVADAGATSPAEAGPLDAVLAALESRLRDKGGGDEDWELLAKSYEFIDRADAALLARAHKLPAAGTVTAAAAARAATPGKPNNASERLLADAAAAIQKRDFKAAEKIYAQLAASRQMTADAWANYADVAASLNGNALTGKPAEYLRNALQLDAAHSKALWLQGSLEHETRQYAAAVATWRKLLTVLDGDSSDAQLIRANIDEDTRLAGGLSQAAPAAASSGLVLRGEVTISAALQSRVKPGQVIYVVAKSLKLPGMPAAVRRLQTGRWPLSFELSDSDAMVPERRLSAVGPVTIEARISQTGQANSAPGDLLGTTTVLDPARAGPLRIVIEKEVRD